MVGPGNLKVVKEALIFCMNYIKDEDSKQLYKKYYSMAENLYYGQIKKTRFLNPYELNLVISILNKFDLIYKIFSSHQDAERKVVFFSQIDFEFDELVKEDLTVLFFEKKDHGLNHRDILGALMSLGIERDLIGDILVDDDNFEISILKEISDFIRFNLNSIKRLNVNLSEKDTPYMDSSLLQFEDFTVTISSLRLDAFVASCINASRNDAQKLINREFVKLNFIVEKNVSSQVEEGDCISVRGHGRYYFREYINKTRKDKKRILVRKLI